MPFTAELHTRDPMKSQSMHYSGRRSRRGRRKRSVGGEAPIATKQKPTFWERVIAFFKGKGPQQVAAPPKPPIERPVQNGATTKKKKIRKPKRAGVTSPQLY